MSKKKKQNKSKQKFQVECPCCHQKVDSLHKVQDKFVFDEGYEICQDCLNLQLIPFEHIIAMIAGNKHFDYVLPAYAIDFYKNYITTQGMQWEEIEKTAAEVWKKWEETQS